MIPNEMQKYNLYHFTIEDYERLSDADAFRAATKHLHDDFRLTELGQWIIDNSVETKIDIYHDVASMQHHVMLIGHLSPEAETYYRLRWL